MTALLEIESHTANTWHSHDVKALALGLFARGATQSEVHRRTGVPLGTLKRWRASAKKAPAITALESPAPDLPPKETGTCTEGCGTELPYDDKAFLEHLVVCPRSWRMLRQDACRLLKEMECSSSSAPPPKPSTPSMSRPETLLAQLRSSTAGERRQSSNSPEPIVAEDTDDFSTFAAEAKASQWDVEGNLEFHRASELYCSKFSPKTGEVVPGWSHAEWTLKRMAGCKPTSSRNAHTALRP